MIIPKLLYNIADISKLVTEPLYDLATYIDPKFGISFSDSKKIVKQDSPSLDSFFVKEERIHLREQVAQLQKKVGLCRKVIPYFSMDSEFKHFGGRWSMSCPIVQIPLLHLQRDRSGQYGIFGREKNSQKLQQEDHLFTDLETQFLITRELVMIKQNDSMMKTAARIGMVVGFVLMLYLPALGLAIGAPICAAMLLFYFLVERITQEVVDRKAIEILAKDSDIQTVVSSAETCLEKLRKMKIEERKESFSGPLFIKENGDDRWDITRPSLSKRLKKLQDTPLYWTTKLMKSIHSHHAPV